MSEITFACTACGEDAESAPDVEEMVRGLSHRWRRKREAAKACITAVCDTWLCNACLDEAERGETVT